MFDHMARWLSRGLPTRMHAAQSHSDASPSGLRSAAGGTGARSTLTTSAVLRFRWLLLAGGLFAGAAFAQSADMVLAQHVVTPDPVPAGGVATITITVNNNGTSSAANVRLTDTIPAGSTFVSMTASNGGTCTAVAPYVCTWASIPFPGSRTVTLRVTLPTAAVWTNSAALTSDTADNNAGNNSLSRNITVVAAANWRSATSTSRQPTVTCTHTRASNLAVNSDAPTLSIPATNSNAGTLTNNVCLALSGGGPVEAGDTPGFERNCVGAGITGTTGVNSADLQIVKNASPGSVVVGQNLTYTIVATNLSTSVDATNVHVYDTVNNLVSTGGLQSITTTQGSCTPAGPYPLNGVSQVVDCNLGTLLRNGGSATIVITVRPNNTTAAVLARGNTATVNSLDVGDPDRSNNSSTVSSNVEPRVDATVTKTVNPSSNVRVGQPTVYTVTARNGGPSRANELIITDVMPPNTAFVSVGTPSNSGTCSTVPAVNSVGGTLSCRWTNVDANSNRTVTFTVRPLAAALVPPSAIPSM